MPAIADFLDVKTTADALNTTPLAVSRLIAKGILPASRIGPAGPFRVAEENLRAFILKNCPDLAMPPVDAAGWIVTPFDNQFQFFRDAIQKAAADQELSTEKVMELFRDVDPRTNSIDVPLKITPAVQKVLDSPPAYQGFQTPAQRAEPQTVVNRSFVLTYFVVGLRDAAEKILQQNPNLQPVDQLYASPEDYNRITNQARDAFTRTSVSFSKAYPKPAPELGRWVQVFYILPHKNLLNSNGVKTAIDAAF